MPGVFFRALAVVVLSAASATAQQTAQPAAPTDAKVTVSLDDTTAPPDWELSVPVSVQVAEGTEVGRLSVRISYPTAAVSYLGVKATETLTKAGLAMKASDPTTKGETASVELEFAPAEKKPAALPSGRIAIVTFKVAHDAEEKGWPMTAEDVRAWSTAPGAAALQAAAKGPATLTVASAGLPIFACFFYMH